MGRRSPLGGFLAQFGWELLATSPDGGPVAYQFRNRGPALQQPFSVTAAKALDAIEKHNQLADLYNAKCDELAALGQQKQAGEIKKDRQEDAKLAHDLRPGVDKAGAEDARLDLPQQARKERKPGRNQQSETGTVGDPAADVVEQLRAQLIAKDEQLAAKDVQLGAKDQKIQNLRTQINRAHVSLTEEREGRGVGQA